MKSNGILNFINLKKMKEPVIKARHYSNATECKLYNKRVMAFTAGKDNFKIIFKTFTKDNDADEPRSSHYNFKDKIVATVFNLSRDGAESLIYALRNELDRTDDTEKTINLEI